MRAIHNRVLKELLGDGIEAVPPQRSPGGPERAALIVIVEGRPIPILGNGSPTLAVVAPIGVRDA